MAQIGLVRFSLLLDSECAFGAGILPSRSHALLCMQQEVHDSTLARLGGVNFNCFVKVASAQFLCLKMPKFFLLKGELCKAAMFTVL